MRIVSKPLPTGLSYILYDTKLTFNHDPFDIETSPIQHNFCGDLSYTVLFNHNMIGDNSNPMTYEASSFEIYSEDYSLLGTNSIKVQGYLTAYTGVTSEPLT